MKLIVMLIATGVHGPATLQGFTSLQACENARPLVAEFYKQATRPTPRRRRASSCRTSVAAKRAVDAPPRRYRCASDCSSSPGGAGCSGVEPSVVGSRPAVSSIATVT